MKNRLYNQIYAFLNNYFWTPCPMCGKKFGGHEAKGSLLYNLVSGKCVCPDCTEEANKINKINIKKWSNEVLKSDFITFKFVAEIDGDSICIGTEEEMSKLPPEQKYVIWKKLSKKEMILLLMGLQDI